MGRKEMTKEQMAEVIKELESKLERRGKNRGDEVIDIIKDGSDYNINYVCEKMGIKNKNFSSILNGIKKRGDYGKEFIIIGWNVSGESGKIYKYISKNDEGFEVFKMMK